MSIDQVKVETSPGTPPTPLTTPGVPSGGTVVHVTGSQATGACP